MTGPTVISVLNPKGGVGKSTVSVHLATGLHRAGLDTVLLDTDPQGSAAEWMNILQQRQSPQAQEEYPFVDTVDLRQSADQLPLEIQRHQERGVVVIDGSAKTNSQLGVSLRESQLVFVPTKPSMLDLKGTAGFLDLVETVQNGYDTPRDLPVARGLATQVRAGTQEVNRISEVFQRLRLQELSYEGEPIRLHQRVAFSRSLASGSTVFDRWSDLNGRSSSDGKAKNEAIDLTNAAIQLINSKVFANEQR
jgi:chromosome partitioning protein